jgi:hypothetical protein
VHDVVVTARDVNPKETHEGGQRLTGYVGNAEVIRFIRHAACWRRFFRCSLAASNFRSRPVSRKPRSHLPRRNRMVLLSTFRKPPSLPPAARENPP